MRALLAALLCAFALAAPLQAQQIHVINKVGFEPTSFHEQVYSMMEQCTGKQGDFSAVRWYIAQTILIDLSTGRQAWALWTQEKGFPEIILNREAAFDGGIVSHEILHDLYKGEAPMDVAQACILDWKILQFKEPEDGQ